MKNTSFLIAFLALFAVVLSSFVNHANSAQTGDVTPPYIWSYTGDPTNVSTSVINPPIGSLVIDPVTGIHRYKTSALGDNTGFNVIGAPQFSGSGVLTSGTGSALATGTVGALSTFATIPANSGSFIVTGIDLIVTPIASGTITALPSVKIIGGTNSVVLTGSLSLTGTTAIYSNALTMLNPLPFIVTGTAAAAIKTQILVSGTQVTSGTAFQLPFRGNVRGYFNR